MTPLPNPSIIHVASVIQQALAPVFLLAGIGAFLNVCASRLARIIDRARALEPQILSTHGRDHARLIAEVRILDRRMAVVNNAIFLTVLAAVLICGVVALMFIAALTQWKVGSALALMFIAAMVSTGAGFAVFLYETRIGSRAVRVRNSILEHQPDIGDDETIPPVSTS